MIINKSSGLGAGRGVDAGICRGVDSVVNRS